MNKSAQSKNNRQGINAVEILANLLNSTELTNGMSIMYGLISIIFVIAAGAILLLGAGDILGLGDIRNYPVTINVIIILMVISSIAFLYFFFGENLSCYILRKHMGFSKGQVLYSIDYNDNVIAVTLKYIRPYYYTARVLCDYNGRELFLPEGALFTEQERAEDKIGEIKKRRLDFLTDIVGREQAEKLLRSSTYKKYAEEYFRDTDTPCAEQFLINEYELSQYSLNSFCKFVKMLHDGEAQKQRSNSECSEILSETILKQEKI